MKELNELELREVDGGVALSMFFILGPSAWFTCAIADLCTGFENGYNANKR